MGRRKKSGYFSHGVQSHSAHTPCCAWEGCNEPGIFKAPKSRDSLHDYQYLCEVHIRAFNKQWNYFDGMDSDAIYAYQKSAVTGHRPTWKNNEHKTLNTDMLGEALERMIGEKCTEDIEKVRRQSSIPKAQRDALAMLDLEHPAAIDEIKKAYKMLAKKFHPDFNHGDKKAEEMFKRISHAYAVLIEEYASA